MNSRVKDVMAKDVVSVQGAEEYKAVIAVIRELRVSAFPVLNSADHVMGMMARRCPRRWPPLALGKPSR